MAHEKTTGIINTHKYHYDTWTGLPAASKSSTKICAKEAEQKLLKCMHTATKPLQATCAPKVWWAEELSRNYPKRLHIESRTARHKKHTPIGCGWEIVNYPQSPSEKCKGILKEGKHQRMNCSNRHWNMVGTCPTCCIKKTPCARKVLWSPCKMYI